MAASWKPAGCLLLLLAAWTPSTAQARPHLKEATHRRALHQQQQGNNSTTTTFAPCAINGNPAGPEGLHAAVTCLELWPAPSAPLRVPADSPSEVWGQLTMQPGRPVTAVLTDRDGDTYPILASAGAPDDMLAYQYATPLVIVKGTLNVAGNVTSYTPMIFVPFSTVMASYKDTQFEGVVYNSEPRPVGPNETSWIRWTFSNVITVDGTKKYDTLLMGSFDNLFRSVKDSNGVCRPALCDDPTFSTPACQYYTESFGNSTDAMTLNWDSGMHFTADSELVPIFPSHHRQYMASLMQLYNLLNPYSFVPAKHVFLAHGTPMGIPQNFTGTLTKATTKIEYC